MEATAPGLRLSPWRFLAPCAGPPTAARPPRHTRAVDADFYDEASVHGRSHGHFPPTADVSPLVVNARSRP